MRATARRRRIGRFAIQADAVDQGHPVVSRIMSQCHIVRAEHLFIHNRIVYEAYSWRFREVLEGEVMPDYVWTWDDETGVLDCEEDAYPGRCGV